MLRTYYSLTKDEKRLNLFTFDKIGDFESWSVSQEGHDILNFGHAYDGNLKDCLDWRVSEICNRIFITCDFHNWPQPQRAIKSFMGCKSTPLPNLGRTKVTCICLVDVFLFFDNLQSKSHLTANQISIKRGNIFKFQN